MKCKACKYEFVEKHNREEGKGYEEEKFRKINGNFTIKGTGWNEAITEVWIFACPKFWTLKAFI